MQWLPCIHVCNSCRVIDGDAICSCCGGWSTMGRCTSMGLDCMKVDMQSAHRSDEAACVSNGLWHILSAQAHRALLGPHALVYDCWKCWQLVYGSPREWIRYLLMNSSQSPVEQKSVLYPKQSMYYLTKTRLIALFHMTKREPRFRGLLSVIYGLKLLLITWQTMNLCWNLSRNP